MTHILAPFLLILTFLAGCGQAAVVGPNTGNQVQPVSASGSLIVEPGDGAAPYLALVRGARRAIDVNSYLLTDRDLVAALVERAAAGVRVRVIVAGNPYHDQQAVAAERNEFAGTRVQFRLAPAPFEGRYVYDHAKYLVADPGLGGRAILGSSNLDHAGLGGGNREYDYETGDPAVVANLATVFDADWAGKSARTASPGPLVVAPGAESPLVAFIQGARKRLYIESEELGSDRAVLDAVAAAARRGVAVEVVLPRNLSAADRRNAAALAGAQVRYLAHPYPHAKLMVADDRMFLGSENISVSSLDRNREVGIMLAGGPVDRAVQAFGTDFAAAR